MTPRFRPSRIKALIDAYVGAGVRAEDVEIEILPDGAIRARHSSAPRIPDEAEELERRIWEGVNGGSRP